MAVSDRPEDGGRAAAKRTEKRDPFAFIKGRHNELERRDIRFRWGHYGFRLLRFHWTTFAPAHVIGFHQHAEFEFHFIPRGRGVVHMGGRAHPFHEGMFYVTGPGVEHRQEADAAEGMDELCLHIDIVKLPQSLAEAGAAAGDADEGGAFVSDWGTQSEVDEAEECVRRLSTIPLHPAVDQFGAMDRFRSAFSAWLEQEQGMYTSIKQAVIQILLRSVRAYGPLPMSSRLPERNMNDYRAQLASQFIEANYMRPITLGEVAANLRISSRQLQRIFREHGMGSFGEIVEQVRLSKVCESLAASNEPIESIALAQGFASANYLYAVFRKRMGLTPGEYRELKRNEAK